MGTVLGKNYTCMHLMSWNSENLLRVMEKTTKYVRLYENNSYWFQVAN